jgi:hypothetical protein
MDGFRRKGNIGFDYTSLCERVASRLDRHVALSYCNTASYNINLSSNKSCFWHSVCNVCRMQRALRPRPVQPTPAGAIRQEGNRAATGRLRSRLRTFRKRPETRARKAREKQKKNRRTTEEHRRGTRAGNAIEKNRERNQRQQRGSANTAP